MRLPTARRRSPATLRILLTASALACASETAPPDLPRSDLGVEDRSAWHTRLGWPDECEEAFAVTAARADAGLTFHDVADGLALLEIRCAGGAYQPSWMYVRIDDRADTTVATLLTFPVMETHDGETLERTGSTELRGLPEFLPETGELTVLSFSRQTLDCGTWARYSVADGEPRLVELRARLPCPAEPQAAADPEPGRPPEGWTMIPVN